MKAKNKLKREAAQKTQLRWGKWRRMVKVRKGEV